MIPTAWSNPLNGREHAYAKGIFSAIDRSRICSARTAGAMERRMFSLRDMPQAHAPKSSAHLLVGTVERRGYLQKNALSGKYCFGLKPVSLSRAALENLDLREEANPHLQALMRETGLTGHMAALEHNEAVIIEKIECPGLLRLATCIGRRLDVNCSGVGSR